MKAKVLIANSVEGQKLRGIMTMRQLDTEVLEVAADCKTAKGIWISSGHETFLRNTENVAPTQKPDKLVPDPHVGLNQVQGGVHQLRHIKIRPETAEEFPDPSGGEVGVAVHLNTAVTAEGVEPQDKDGKSSGRIHSVRWKNKIHMRLQQLKRVRSISSHY